MTFIKAIQKFRYFAFLLLLIIEFRLYDFFYIRASSKVMQEMPTVPLILPVMGMLVLMGATLFAERYFNVDKNLPFNAIGKVLALVIAVLYYFYLLPIPVRRSFDATLFLFCIGGFLLVSLIRDLCLLLRRNNKRGF